MRIRRKIFCAVCNRTIKMKCECGSIKWVLDARYVQEILNKSDIDYMELKDLFNEVHDL